MRRLFFLLLCSTLILWSAGCDATDDESGTVTLVGEVFDASRNQPLANAFVTVQAEDNPDIDENEDIIIETDERGQYETSFEIDRATEVQLTARRDGFTTDQQTIFAVAGRTITVPRFSLQRTREEEPTSGTPSNILLLSQSSESIGVVEGGAQEVATLTFQVADSAGRPVTLENEALVRFRLGVQPGGGEFIAPQQAGTNDRGQVEVNLSSGTRAGVVQVIAEATVDGRTIRSKPVPISIHGGFPDAVHFSAGPDVFNFPGLLRFGLTNPVSVLVGDRYGNPARPGSSVYFTTDSGVIEGSTLTDDQGRGTVDLISGRPLPPRGVAIVSIEAAGTEPPYDANAPDYGEVRITDQFPVILSGVPVVTVSPTTARLGQTYSLTVVDQNGNPLAGGTTISVRAEGTKVKATGNTAVTLDDSAFLDQNGDGDALDYEDVLRGRGITEFTFRVVEDQTIDEGGVPTIETVTITVSGSNGSVEIVLTAEGTVATLTENATVEMRPTENAAVVRLDPSK